ncbi:MAG: rhomboid family intramembrane serine protease [Fimbriimonadaceae bacterium]
MSAPTRLPILTLLLTAANLFAAFAVLLDPLLVDQFGFNAARPTVLTAFTSMFLHLNVFHLLGNMLFLAAVGASVELATGWYRFLLVYFGSGLCGVLVHAVAMRHVANPAPLIGASGALAGCAGYYAVRYARLRVPVGPNLSATILAVAVGWFVLQLIGAVVRLGDAGVAVSYWAHLGGFAAGIVLSFAFRGPDVGQERLDRQVLDSMRDRGPAAEAVAARKHVQRHPRDMATLRRLADALETLGDHDERSTILLRIYDLSGPEDRTGVLKEIIAAGGAAKLASARRMALARELAASEPEVTNALYESVSDSGEAGDRAEALFALAERRSGSDPDASKLAAKRLVELFPDHPAATRIRARGML